MVWGVIIMTLYLWANVYCLSWMKIRLSRKPMAIIFHTGLMQIVLTCQNMNEVGYNGDGVEMEAT